MALSGLLQLPLPYVSMGLPTPSCLLTLQRMQMRKWPKSSSMVQQVNLLKVSTLLAEPTKPVSCEHVMHGEAHARVSATWALCRTVLCLSLSVSSCFSGCQ
jgi:hypothetical protein